MMMGFVVFSLVEVVVMVIIGVRAEFTVSFYMNSCRRIQIQ